MRNDFPEPFAPRTAHCSPVLTSQLSCERIGVESRFTLTLLSRNSGSLPELFAMPTLSPEQASRSSSRNAATLLFLHGFGGTGAEWEPVSQHLKGRYNTLCPDLPGHGSSRVKPRHFVSWLRTIILEELGAPAVIIGYSLGARLALQFALTEPALVSALILESLHPGLHRRDARRARLKQDSQRSRELRRLGSPRFFSRWQWSRLFTGQHHINRNTDAWANARTGQQPERLAEALKSFSTGHQGWLPAPEDIPVELIAGVNDDKFVRLHLHWAEGKPAVHCHQVTGAWHNTHLEASSAFTLILDDCLRKFEDQGYIL
jgi:2-succinyl-6-hydroxy-2,4-cyclohexadiene-1-carboxylate synthase